MPEKPPIEQNILRPKTENGPENGLKNKKSFAVMVKNFSPRLYGYLIQRLGNKDDAQELAQEAYLRLLKMEKTKLIDKPESYLFRIASNLANDFVAQRRHHPRPIPLDAIEEKAETGDGDRFEKNIEHRNSIKHLEKIMQSLPPHYHAVLLLHKRDGCSREEIAAQLGLSIHTVKKYLTRALAHCREKWAEQ